MRNRSKLTLVTNNQNLKTYYVPLTRIEISFHPINANNLEEAIYKANNGKCESACKRFVLEETHTNEAYTSTHIPDENLLARQIDHYHIEIKDLSNDSRKPKPL